MKKILVIGSTGQIGTELVSKLRNIYRKENIVSGYFGIEPSIDFFDQGPAVSIDATNLQQIADVVKKYKIDTIYNLAAILSAVGEKNPMLAWHVGIASLMNCLAVARIYHCAVFTPSSIGAFGVYTPRDHTPQDTIQRPRTMYGITKVTGELLSDYYFYKYGVDTRSVRFPGLISYSALPGGGTTDYAVDIYYAAVRGEVFTCSLKAGTFMDMMYMP